MRIADLISGSRDLATNGHQDRDDYQDLKARTHHYVIQRIEEDDAQFGDDVTQLKQLLQRYIEDFFQPQRLRLDTSQTQRLVADLVDELTGYGPLQALLDDGGVDDILINGPCSVFVERGGKLEETGLRFINDRHVLRVIRKMIAPLGRRIDEANPIVDGRLPDGSRINAIIPPLSLAGPCLSIRKFKRDPLTAEDLIARRALTAEALSALREAVSQRRNILISGATGSGKTTLLNILSQYIPAHQRVVTIEDAAELQLRNGHVVRLETRPPNSEGAGEITAHHLLKNALRMRPDRIIVGESRGAEVLDMLQAMNTGHTGSMSTVHANSATDALTRLEVMISLSGFHAPGDLLRRMIGSAIDIIVHITRLDDGRRSVSQICELNTTDTEVTLTDLYRFDPVRDTLCHATDNVAQLRWHTERRSAS